VKRQYKSLKEGNKRWKTIIEGGTAVKRMLQPAWTSEQAKNGNSFSLPLELSNSLKCVLSHIGEAIVYGAYNFGDRGYAKTEFREVFH